MLTEHDGPHERLGTRARRCSFPLASATWYSADSPFSEIHAQSAKISESSTAAASLASSRVQARVEPGERIAPHFRGSPGPLAPLEPLASCGSGGVPSTWRGLTPPGSVKKLVYCARRTASSKTCALNVAATEARACVGEDLVPGGLVGRRRVDR